MESNSIRALVVDDEHLAAVYLEKLLSSFEGVTVAGLLSSSSDALEFIASEGIDVAFLDIEMPGMNGLELLEEMKKVDQDIQVVLVTGYGQYALEAYEKHALGYLLKPCSREDVAYYLDQVRRLCGNRRRKPLRIAAFGPFEVFAGDERVAFSNAKAKELLALLVDARGAGVSIETAASVLWEGHPFDDSAKALVRRAVADLRKVAREYGADGLVAGERGFVSLSSGLVDCDFFGYLETGSPEFGGEYMSRYSWAEETAAALSFGRLL